MVEFPSNAINCSQPSLHKLFLTLPYLDDVTNKAHADLEWRKQSLEELAELTPVMKVHGVHAHQVELDEDFLLMVKSVKSNLTDS